MDKQPVDLGTQVRNAARALIYPLYVESQEDSSGWGTRKYVHAGREHAYSKAVAMLDNGKTLEEVRAGMVKERSEAYANITRPSDLYAIWDRTTFTRNEYNEDYISAADNVIGILDRILGTK